MLSEAGPGRTLLAVRVTPKGGRDAIDGADADADGRPILKLRVAAPPQDGAANKAVVKLVAKALGVPKSAVAIVAGQTARLKRLEIEGDPDQLADRLAAALS
ncbi:MAG: DUF167 family protein [Pseudomonadota bacterium]